MKVTGNYRNKKNGKGVCDHKWVIRFVKLFDL